MKTLFTALTLLVAGTLLGWAPAASAHEDWGDVTDWPTVLYPATDRDHDGGPVDIQLQGQRHAFHTLAFAIKMDREIPGIRIHAKGTCAQHPRRFCITILQVNDPDTWWWGLTNIYASSVLIRLNAYWGIRPWPAGHEFLHALGLAHHRFGSGMEQVPTPSLKAVSSQELAALRGAYPAPECTPFLGCYVHAHHHR